MKILKTLKILSLAFVFCAVSGVAYSQEPRTENRRDDPFPGARSETYKTVGDVRLSLWIFEPPGHRSKDLRPAVVFFFGGGWRAGTPAQFRPHAEHLAERGMVAVLADYRVSSRHGTKALQCVQDAKSAVRWLRANAERLGVDPKRIVASGGSAGGHLAACAGVIPALDEPGEAKSVSSVPDALVLFNPAVVLAPVRGLGSTDSQRTRRLAERLGTEPDAISPYHHVKTGVPPTLIFHGTADRVVPFATVELFAKAMREVGSRCELVPREGAGHGFFNHGRGDGSAYTETLARMDSFLVELGYLGEQKETIADGPLETFLTESRMETKSLFDDERFPNIVVTTKGTVLATWGSKRIRVRRSEDGGESWDEAIVIANPGFHGGGTTVDETTGDVLVFVEGGHPPAPLTVYRSRDDGKTWHPEKVIVRQDSRGNALSMHMNEHGITLRHGGHKGRLLRPARYYGKRNDREEWPTHYTSAIYSDDHGRTWSASEPFPENGTGEATVAELSDGRIYYNSRVHWEKRPKNTRRRCAWSDDGGKTWKDWSIVEVLPDGPQNTNYGCMGGLVRLPVRGRDILIYSNCDSSAGRKLGTVWASFDGGKTWPLKRLVHESAFAYSSLTAGRPGTKSQGRIYLHFESGGSKVAVFNLAWLLQGEKTADGSVPAWVSP